MQIESKPWMHGLNRGMILRIRCGPNRIKMEERNQLQLFFVTFFFPFFFWNDCEDRILILLFCTYGGYR